MGRAGGARLLAVAALCIVALMSGCLQLSFEQAYSDLKVIEAKYKLGELIVPAEPKDILSYRSDLEALKSAAEKNPGTPANNALLQLVEIKLDIVDMYIAFLVGAQEVSMLDYQKQNCQEGGHLANAIEAFDAALTQSSLATQKLELFEKSFGKEARQAGLALDNLKKAVEAMAESAKQSKELVKQACPSAK